MRVLTPATVFDLPAGAEAVAPPERRGLGRDGGRLLVARPDGLSHHRFRDLPTVLVPGDLVVLNTSATLAAALGGTDASGAAVPVHVSTQLDDSTWVVELRRPDNTGPDLTRTRGEWIGLPAGAWVQLMKPYPDPTAASSRLWRARPSNAPPLAAYLAMHGRPIEYGYLRSRFTLADHQTVYAGKAGSAEMPSAGRPFTDRMLVQLITRGVTIAPLVLHTGVSSPELHEPPTPERFAVPPATADAVNAARAAGRRVIAVGTTVVRALETVADADGRVRAAAGWTDLVIGPDRPIRVVTGLLSGLHPPEATHLVMLETVAGARLVADAYAAALERRYLWHEFGDSMLFLGSRQTTDGQG
ncbi:MAG TPA: S-adenosylmethionine:tRNA ribosyltransferase-isomerase [Sporichthyaceae bacterium]|jgi:S-adenosylmethionine:tRNA ribosyltransferase-isomerase